MRYHLNDGGTRDNRTRWESAKIVLEKISVFYEKANIPMISDRKAREKMIHLLHDNDKIRAIPSNSSYDKKNPANGRYISEDVSTMASNCRKCNKQYEILVILTIDER